jgi:hypothetical protein
MSAHFPAGLGVGLAEKDGLTTPGSKCESVPMVKRPVEEPKIKRKPVPSAEVDDENVIDLGDDVKRVSISHAM